MHPGLLSPRRSRPRSRGAALLLTVLVVLSAATITAVLVQVAVQAAGGQKRRLAYELAFEQANTIERRVANVFAQDPLRVFDEVLADEVPRVCVGDQASYPSAFGAGSSWPASCGALWSYEGTANLAKGARVFPPSPSDPTWRVEVFAEVGSERVGFTRTFLVGGRDRPMLYSGGALDLSALPFAPVLNGPVYANGDVTLGTATLVDDVLVASESSVLDPGSSMAASAGASGAGIDLDVRAALPSPLPASMLVSSLNELNRVACRDTSPSLVVQGASRFATALCLTAGTSLVDEAGVTRTFPSAGSYEAVLVVPESDARLRVFTRADVPAAWPGAIGAWTELGVFPLPGHGLVATDALTVLGHCDELAGACRDWDGDAVPGSRIDASFTLLVGSASSPADLYVGGPLRAGAGRAGAVVSGALRFPLEATPAAAALPVDLSVAVLGRPGSASVASSPDSSGGGSRQSLAWSGAVLLAEFSLDLDGFTSVALTVPAESSEVPPLLPSPGLLARSDYARRLPQADLDALFVLGEASGLSVPSAPGLLDLEEADSVMALTWSSPSSDGGVGVSDYVVEYRESGASSWSVFSDAVSTALTSSVTGLANGTAYEFRVAAVNGVGQGPFSGTLTATPFVLPLAPAALAVSSVPGSTSTLDLSWNAVTNVEIQGYNVYRQNLLSGVFELVASPTGTSHTDTDLTAGVTYTYKVAAVSPSGEGVRSAVSSAQTEAFSPLAPTITDTTRGNLTATLSFTSVSSSERPVEGFDFLIDGVVVASSADASLTSYTFTGLTEGTVVLLGVATTNAEGSSSVVTSSVSVIASPNAPTTLVVVPEQDVPGSLSLSWTAPTNQVPDGFYVYRKNDLTGLYEVIATVTVPSHLDDVLDIGVLYAYRVSAFVDTLEGGLSGVVSATPIDVPLDAVVLTSTLADLSVTLTFAVDELDGRPVDGYRLFLDAVEVADIPAPASEYEFTGLVDGFTYEFGVQGYNAAGDGAPASVLVTAYSLPAEVTGLAVERATDSGSALLLSWDEPAGTYDGFYLYRENSVTSLYEVVATVSGTSYRDSSLVVGSLYSYRVAAFNAVDAGPMSTTVSATPDIVPGAPTITAVTAASAQLSVAFTAGSNSGTTVTGYEYSTDNGSTWRSRASGTTASPLVITAISGSANTALTNGVTYQVRLRAVNAAGSGTASPSAPGTPSLPAAPTLVAPSGALDELVYCRYASNCSGLSPSVSSNETFRFAFTGAASSFYWIQAMHATGGSSWSGSTTELSVSFSVSGGTLSGGLATSTVATSSSGTVTVSATGAALADKPVFFKVTQVSTNVAAGGAVISQAATTDVLAVYTTAQTTQFTAPGTGSVQYLVVAGGGAGSSGTAGGGGAGGMSTGALAVSTGVQYTVTVGAGGAAPPGVTSVGSNGSNSVFGSVTSIGGGRGASSNPGTNAGSGGSGGGGAYYPGWGSGSTGSGTAGQGASGGAGIVGDSNTSGGGGGGGAGGAGGQPNGGVGLQSSITGVNVYYAGGGGGARYSGAGGSGSGGAGGGGAGADSVASAGTDNTGGGGGGGWLYASGQGARGGSGIVIVRYQG